MIRAIVQEVTTKVPKRVKIDSSLRSYSSTASLSSSSSPPPPLFLWLTKNKGVSKPTSDVIINNCQSRLLVPTTNRNIYIPTIQDDIDVTSISNDIADLISQQYDLAESTANTGGQAAQQQHQFVGGMGEDDPGVWFVADTSSTDDDDDDALNYVELINETIELVKQERHGIPFGIYTNGLISTADMSELQNSLSLPLQVSLFGSNPTDYTKITSGRPSNEFGMICGFIVTSTEEYNMPVEVSFVQDHYTGDARDLALSLGAQDVHVY